MVRVASRKALMVTGKKARYTAIMATAPQTGSPILPPQMTTIGAIATSGTV